MGPMGHDVAPKSEATAPRGAMESPQELPTQERFLCSTAAPRRFDHPGLRNTHYGLLTRLLRSANTAGDETEESAPRVL